MDWNKLKKEYISGAISYRQLAAKHGVSFNNLKNVAVKEHWADLRERARNRTTTALVQKISEKNARIDDKYYDMVDKLYKKADEVIDAMPVWSVSSVKEMATALKYLKECKGIRSEADAREQEARISKLQKECAADDGTNAEISVTFLAEKDGDIEESGEWAE